LAIGICGSLARGDYHERSDIDIFVVIPEENWHKGIQDEWYYRLYNLLYKRYHRDITVFVYTPELLKKVPCWATLNMVTEGILVIDRAGISKIFERIIERAKQIGLALKKIGKYPTWVMGRPVRPGEVISLEV
jgi:predicted nucleotidyltransferase